MAWIRLFFNSLALALGLALAALALDRSLGQQAAPWREVAQGRAMAEAGNIPLRDPLLYTAMPARGFDTRSWAFDLGAFAGVQAAGPQFLRWLDRLAILLGLFGVAAATFRRGARPFSGVLCIVAATWASLVTLHPGPALWAWALAALALASLEGPFWEAFFARWVYVAPIALLWTNVHASAWVLAPLLTLWVFFEGNDADPARPLQSGLAKGAMLALLGVLLALNPAPLESLRAGLHSFGPSPLLDGADLGRQLPLLFLAGACLALIASSWTLQGREAWARDLSVMGLATVAALFSRDALPLALLYAAPMTAKRADLVVDALPGALRLWRWPLKVIALGAVLVVLLPHGKFTAWQFPSPVADRVRRGPAPQRLLAFYERELLDLKLLCPPEWAGEVAWTLGSHVRLALDERGEAVTEKKAVQALQQALAAEGVWRETLLGAQVEACLLPLGSPLAQALARAAEWQPVAFDNAAVLYVRNLPPVADLIRVEAPRGLRPGDPAQPFDPGRLAQAEADLEARLARDPGMGVLHFYAAELWLAKGQNARARQSLETGVRLDPSFAPNYFRLAQLRQKAGQADATDIQPLLRRGQSLGLDVDWRLALDRLGAD